MCTCVGITIQYGVGMRVLFRGVECIVVSMSVRLKGTEFFWYSSEVHMCALSRTKAYTHTYMYT